MPLQKLQFRPGINREGTTLANEGGWFDGDKIRFRSGYPEKIGGWSAVSYSTYKGVCRSLWNWSTLKSFNIIGLGTNLKFYLENGRSYYDITPIEFTTVNAVSFAATPGSSVITVTDVGATNLKVNNFVTYSGAVSLGGNVTADVLNQEYQIKSVLTNTSYTIVVPVVANAFDVGNGGGSVTAEYQIDTGSDIFTYGTGWGISPYGGFVAGSPTTQLSATINSSVTTIPVVDTSLFTSSGTVLIGTELITYSGKTLTSLTGCTRGTSGTSAAAHIGGTNVFLSTTFAGWGTGYTPTFGTQLRLWSQSNFGEKLLFNPRGGAFYVWDPGCSWHQEYTYPDLTRFGRAYTIRCCNYHQSDCHWIRTSVASQHQQCSD